MHLYIEKLMSSAHILLGKQIGDPVSLLCIHAITDMLCIHAFTYVLLCLMLSMLSILKS